MAEARLTTAPVISTTLRFGLPLALAMACHGLFNCIDLIIVGRLGPGAVAAVTIGGIINMVGMLVFNGIANVVSGRAALLAGAEDIEGLAEVETASRRLTWMASLVLGVFFALIAWPLVTAFGADEATATDAAAYLMILSAGSGTMFFLLHQCAVLRAVGDSRRPMVALVGANTLNLALDLVLVFGLAGFPRMGVLGAAWATVLSRLLGALYLGRVLKARRRTWPHAAGLSGVLQELLKKGMAHSAQMVARVVSIYFLLLIATNAVAGAGDRAARDLLDGVGVGIRLEMVILFAALGWGTAAASFLGQNAGAGRFDRAARGLGAIIICSLLFCLGLGSVLFFWPEDALGLVAPGATIEAVREGGGYLAIILLGHPGLIIAIVLSQALVGFGSVRSAVVLDVTLYLLVLLPFASIASSSGSVARVWWCTAAIHLVSAPLYLLVFRKRFLAEFQKAAPPPAS